MQKLLLKNKYLFFVLIIILTGLITGIIYYLLLNSHSLEKINNVLVNYNNFRYNSIIKDLIIMSLLLVTSLFVVGLPLAIFYLFYEAFSLGFLISIFFINYKLSGLIYILLYFIINKLLIFIFLILIIAKLFNIGRYVMGFFFYKREHYYIEIIISNFKNSIYIIIFVLVINIINYLISPFIFNKLAFLLK